MRKFLAFTAVLILLATVFTDVVHGEKISTDSSEGLAQGGDLYQKIYDRLKSKVGKSATKKIAEKEDSDSSTFSSERTGQTTSGDTQSALVANRQDKEQKYNDEKKAEDGKNELAQKSKSDELFIDGNTDGSAGFDLVNDFNQIEKLLFGDQAKSHSFTSGGTADTDESSGTSGYNNEIAFKNRGQTSNAETENCIDCHIQYINKKLQELLSRSTVNNRGENLLYKSSKCTSADTHVLINGNQELNYTPVPAAHNDGERNNLLAENPSKAGTKFFQDNPYIQKGTELETGTARQRNISEKIFTDNATLKLSPSETATRTQNTKGNEDTKEQDSLNKTEGDNTIKNTNSYEKELETELSRLLASFRSFRLEYARLTDPRKGAVKKFNDLEICQRFPKRPKNYYK